MKNTIEIKTTRMTSWFSSYRWTNSYSFSYDDRVNKQEIQTVIFLDKTFCNLKRFLIEKDKFCFLYTKWFWGDILRRFNSRDWDSRISKDSWFIIYNWKIYLWEVKETEKSDNWNWSFGSATEWLRTYDVTLWKEITLPKISVQIKDKYKTKEWEYVWDKQKQDYILIPKT